ncbi:hypothetical protein [Paenibacillus wulumuqiensis]|uniref:hypothetical protein n=1 Tax=Paenibacillus wulumuqiensis TaxID=1567107 RepID=UPI0006967351|nr:hypothetical protein [Paenibacillus wulumuqiensis]
MRKRGWLITAIIVVVSVLMVPRLFESTIPPAIAPAAGHPPVDWSADKPPAPTITAGKTAIPWVQTTYCWNQGCADSVGGQDAMTGKEPAIVPANTIIHVGYPYDPAPNELIVQQFVNNQPVNIPLQNGSFAAPAAKGTYYYALSASWIKENTEYTLGDTSAAFAIEVR